jgi:hypothetical protein
LKYSVFRISQNESFGVEKCNEIDYVLLYQSFGHLKSYELIGGVPVANIAK